MFLDPQQVLSHVPIQPGFRVADFGVGSGTYVEHILNKLEGEGALYAFDVAPQLVEKLHRKKITEGIENFFSLVADLNKPLPLKDELLQSALIINTLHALTNRRGFVGEAHRVLERGRSVLVVEWASSFNHMGPPPAQAVLPQDAVRLFQSEGFSVGAMLPAGSHHYAFVAKKQ